ncbi:MAG: sigma-54 interaction domain-containing protein [Saprospiraceae bacterium]
MAQTLQGIKQRFGIIGRSPALDNALNTAVRVSGTDLTVLIMGESGVGKEVFSRIIHSLSPRKHNKFIAVNCGAIPEGTINSELFGHEKGAFTGATSDRKGYFETVDGGTIFLDEIGEMPLDTQAYLLRILENGEFIKVGSSKVLQTDVRIVAATNVKLLEKIKKGKFREDLYYRLSTVPIDVPALRERPEDIHLLFRKFCVDFAERYRTPPIQLDDKAKLLLERYNWPGNIRELKNIAEKTSVLSEDRVVTAEDLLEFIPNLFKRNLPTVKNENNGETMQEREILYKLLFDMKGDLNELKTLVFDLIRKNDLRMPDIQNIRQLMPSYTENDYDEAFEDVFPNHTAEGNFSSIARKPQDSTQPIIIEAPVYHHAEEEEEENLSLEDMEMRLITKALQKHNGRRKDAAAELGISERTLYRKIDKYRINE